ncbi:MAG: type II secretion system F family protein [Actinomycetota bacterium]
MSPLLVIAGLTATATLMPTPIRRSPAGIERAPGALATSAGPATTAELGPDLVVLVAVGLGSGRSLLGTIELLVEVGAVGHDHLISALTRHRRGALLIDALEDAGLAGIAPILRSHIEDGTPATEALLGHADALRADARRRAEAQARRLPVRMLLPLTVFVLPGFLALTVAPVVVDALRSFAS